MFFGLTYLSDIPPRDLKDEFTTFIDPFIVEGFQSTMTPGFLSNFENWSRSYYSKQAHLDSVMKFNKRILTPPDDNEWMSTKEECQTYFSALPRVNAMSATSIGEFDKVKYHQSTSAGYGYTQGAQPYPTHKGPRDGPNYKRAKSIAAKIVHECITADANGTFESFLETASANSTPDIAFTRTQLVELPNTKVRQVFGECFHYVLLEGLFACPLIDMFMANNFFYFIGRDPTVEVPRLINDLDPNDNCYYLTIDWSSFDASVQPYEIQFAFELLESILNFPNEATRLVFLYTKQLFLKRKLATPDGKIYLRYGGVPSGSYYTHLIDSIINWVRIKYLLKIAHCTHRMIKTHGDDALVEVIDLLDGDMQLITQTAATLNWMINYEKSRLFKTRTEIEFLGRTSRHGANYRSRMKCLRLMYYPEYPVSDPQISIARLKAIDEDSGYHIPEIPPVYRFLKLKYGDMNVVLPREFRRYFSSQTLNESI